MTRLICCIAAVAVTLEVLNAQSIDTTTHLSAIASGKVVPVTRYVQLQVGEKTLKPGLRVSLSTDEIGQLRVLFIRDSLTNDYGP